MKVSLILTCAGKGERAGFEKNKLLVDFGGETCLSRVFSAFENSHLIDEFIITAAEKDSEEINASFGKKAKIVLGGATRTESVKKGLAAATGDVVLIHDGARPFVTQKIIADCILSAQTFGSGITAIRSKDTVLKSEENPEYLGKDDIYIVQTPQAFIMEEIKRAYAMAGNTVFNDDGEVYAKYIRPVKLVEGDSKNVKLTFKEDFEALGSPLYRFGTGFDCHKLVEGRPLILGGITIPHDKGLLGHSDADALTHAIMDAILSALSLRDIGYHFPDTDPKYKGANSITLLKEVLSMIDEKGYKVSSVSAVIMAEKPKLLSFIPKINENLANVIGIPADKIGIGATTLEGLGFVGREEGICTHATATLIRK